MTEVLGFGLKAKLTESGVPFNFEDKGTHNKYRISINRDKVKVSFDFYDSEANYNENIEELSEESLKWAFRCFLEDSLSGSMEFKEFCSEFGYSDDSIKALKIYKECQKSLLKANKLGIKTEELSDLINKMSELGIE